MKLPFGDWTPDLPPQDNPGALEAKNCLPLHTSYGELKALQPFADALPSAVLGAHWIVNRSATVYNFAGTATALYLFDGMTDYDDVSGVSAPYSASGWDFVNFQERVIATDGGSGDLQYFDVDASPSTVFADLPGSPPRGSCLGRVKDFILVGNFETTDGSNVSEPGGFAWSGFNSTELWTPSKATQAGYRLSRGDGGPVQRIVSGAEAVIFRENAIELVRYIGPPQIMDPSDITTLHGTQAPRSVCWNREFVFYYSPEGFMQYNRLSRQLEAIGDGKVDEWFKENFDPSDVANIRGSIDRKNKLVFWAFRTSGGSTYYNRLLVYNYLRKRFSYIEIDTELIAEFVSVGYNLDTIGAVLSSDDIDAASINVDDPAYLGGNFFLMAFNSAHRASSFAGTPLVAEIDTTELNPDEDRRGYLNGVKALVEGTVATTVEVAPLTRNDTQSSPILGAFKQRNSATAQHDMRVNSRYLRFRVRISGGFSYAQHLKLKIRTRGRQ